MYARFAIAVALGLAPAIAWCDVSGPADPAANADTAAVLRYLQELPNRADNRVLSGQFVCGAAVADGQPTGPLNETTGCYARYVEDLRRRTGKWIALVGADYARLGDDWQLDLRRTNAPLIAHWRRGGLVTVSWHARNPWTGGDARKDKDITGNFDDLLVNGTDAHAAWLSALDDVAGALAELQAAGVVVLWRPLHESNEPAFWWGAGMPSSPSPDQVMRLWHHMFRYLTEDKQLHNLLWVYSATPREKPGTADELLCYPGDQFVDVVGVDLYGNWLAISAYDRLTQLGKPFGLTEFGPAPESSSTGSFDYRGLIEQIAAEYPAITFVQSWSESSKSGKVWALVGHRRVEEFLHHPWTITADEVRWGDRPNWWQRLFGRRSSGSSDVAERTKEDQ